jgi:membrane-associated phospholipid phosphatase
VLFTGLQTWFRLTPDTKMRKFEKPALVAVLLVLFSGFITTWLFKILWGRWTYGDIIASGNLSPYTPWFLPQGPNGHNSFPSGHTNFALTVLPLLLLIPKNNKWNYPAWIAIILWGVINAASRIVIGAHFASDVLFGGCQTILWYWILSRKIIKNL